MPPTKRLAPPTDARPAHVAGSLPWWWPDLWRVAVDIDPEVARMS